MNQQSYYLSGDTALVIEFGNDISQETNKKVYQGLKAIKNAKITGILDYVPAYCSLMVEYDPISIDLESLMGQLDRALEQVVEEGDEDQVIVEIPVVYGGEMGEDLPYVASYHDLTVDEVIELHSQTLYRVYMLGFQPGFPYLGGMAKILSTPRLLSPRQKVEKGSVGIAGDQTGIYPSESPGGWQIIGRTPLELVDWTSEELTLIQPGQFIRFVPIDQKTYAELTMEV